ncbi:MAG: phage gp6-like head-tail connector protein [Lachnospiraceae bacterium]|nr:phage gp6-like head-tail connector protein [Lachnospiraceae bacterium]
MILTLEEVKQYGRIDIDEDDLLLQAIIASAEEYLKNATGKEYPETEENGKKIEYILEKIYLQLLVAYWYEQRTPMGKVGEDFSYLTKSILLQLKLK